MGRQVGPDGADLHRCQFMVWVLEAGGTTTCDGDTGRRRDCGVVHAASPAPSSVTRKN